MQERLTLLGVGALLLLAVLLWDNDAERPCHYPEADVIEPVPAPPQGRVPTFDGGRTTIAPKVTDAVIARIRARRRSV